MDENEKKLRKDMEADLEQYIEDMEKYKVQLFITAIITTLVNMGFAIWTVQLLLGKLGLVLSFAQAAIVFVGVRHLLDMKPFEDTTFLGSKTPKEWINALFFKTAMNIGMFIALRHFVF